MTDPRPSKVLVVDDNAIIRRLQEAQLEALHMELVAAADGAEALTLVKELQPDLVLLDVVMPGMDGFRVCEALKSDPGTREVPVMVVTALGKDAQDRSFAAGADDFMRKPPNTLLLRARSMMHLKIRWSGLAPNAASTGPLLLVTQNSELSISLLSALPTQVKLVRTATIGEAKTALAQKPAAIILDFEVEGARDFIPVLKEQRPHAPILLAHWAEDFTVLEEEHLAVDDYLELPAPPSEVRHRARLLLRLAAAVARLRS